MQIADLQRLGTRCKGCAAVGQNVAAGTQALGSDERPQTMAPKRAVFFFAMQVCRA